MYFKQIDELLSPIVDVTNRAQTLMFTKYEDGTLLARVLLCDNPSSGTNELELETLVDEYIEDCKQELKRSKSIRLKQLQDEIDKIKLEIDYNEESV